MILYKIAYSYTHRDDGFHHKFILAENENKATDKYIQIVDLPNQAHFIQIETICKRDEIIPTIEPKEEFKN